MGYLRNYLRIIKYLPSSMSMTIRCSNANSIHLFMTIYRLCKCHFRS